MNSDRIVLWQIHDEKPGHRNQLRGLAQALAELTLVDCYEIRTPSRRTCLAGLWGKRFIAGDGLPTPDLILGAGHATHLAVLTARRARGGKAIILMKPSLPTALFDLCFIPEHDNVAESEKVVLTRGVLNTIRPTNDHNTNAGLLLIGGPSKAHDWSDVQILQQISAIVESTPSIRWTLSDSRRTPPSFMEKLTSREFNNLTVTPNQTTGPGWVSEQLALASQVWVSEDSVSMVYEALTSGAAVGLLEVPSRRRGRVAAGLDTMLEDGWLTPISKWARGSLLEVPPAQLNEARRCAEILYQRQRHNIAA